MTIRLDFPSPPKIQLHRALSGRGKKLSDGQTVPRFEATIKHAPLTGIARYRRICLDATTGGVPLAFPHILAAPLHYAIFTHKEMPLPALGLVHVRNSITSHAPLDPSQPLSLSVWCEGHEAVRSGVEITLHTSASVNGEVVWEETTTALSRAGKGTGGPRVVEPEPLVGLTRSVSWRLPADLGRRYAPVAGDHNPIHLYPLTAKLFGFSRPIIHGMWMIGRIGGSMAPQAPCTVEMEFRRPVLLPGTVFFSASKDGRFDVRSSRGKLHMYGCVR
ncbi:MAG: acyl dehydratase [Myxococcota bacterium]|jgi:acyl dehydratase